ncbi:MAG: CpsB/CapC family capsule biosynthesis tyrosine phosphatase [Pseudolabrys sp.]
MIDLHCHILPAIDDGAKSLDMSLVMARMAVADGITVTACTPHILPSVYDNTGPAIKSAVTALQNSLDQAGIPLRLVVGADVHVAPDLGIGLRDGHVPTLNGSRYLLLEPPHHVLPPNLEEHIFRLHSVGFVVIVTHPERMSWIEASYPLIQRLVHKGVWMQLTAGSLMGRFGRRPRYWAERMLDDGLCHLLATDAHNTTSRPPYLAEAREAAAMRLGEEEATHLVVTRPQGVLDDVAPAALPALLQRPREEAPSVWQRIFERVAKGGPKNASRGDQ